MNGMWGKVGIMVHEHFCPDCNAIWSCSDDCTFDYKNSEWATCYPCKEKSLEVKSDPIPSHFHNCPSCYTAYPCTLACTIEYDLQDGDKLFGAFCTCEECEAEIAAKKKMFSPEWFKKYNGFIK